MSFDIEQFNVELKALHDEHKKLQDQMKALDDRERDLRSRLSVLHQHTVLASGILKRGQLAI